MSLDSYTIQWQVSFRTNVMFIGKQGCRLGLTKAIDPSAPRAKNDKSFSLNDLNLHHSFMSLLPKSYSWCCSSPPSPCALRLEMGHKRPQSSSTCLHCGADSRGLSLHISYQYACYIASCCMVIGVQRFTKLSKNI